VAINAKLLAKEMVGVAKVVIAEQWPDVRPIAEMEMRKLAQTIDDIERLQQSGVIDQARARLLYDMQHNATRGVLLTVQGVDGLTANRVLDAATRAVGSVVLRRLGID
jgi:hypothetical protein